jgi:hypothetical protein
MSDLIILLRRPAYSVNIFSPTERAPPAKEFLTPRVIVSTSSEQYRTVPAAVRRVDQINAAGYRAYAVELGARRHVVHISEGKRGDLRELPRMKA